MQILIWIFLNSPSSSDPCHMSTCWTFTNSSLLPLSSLMFSCQLSLEQHSSITVSWLQYLIHFCHYLTTITPTILTAFATLFLPDSANVKPAPDDAVNEYSEQRMKSAQYSSNNIADISCISLHSHEEFLLPWTNIYFQKQHDFIKTHLCFFKEMMIWLFFTV